MSGVTRHLVRLPVAARSLPIMVFETELDRKTMVAIFTFKWANLVMHPLFVFNEIVGIAALVFTASLVARNTWRPMYSFDMIP